MKLKSLLFVFAVVLILSGCEKIKDALQVPIEIETRVEGVSLSVPQIPKEAEGRVVTETKSLSLNVDVKKEIEKQGASLENVKKAELVSFVIEKQSSTPEDASLSLIQAMDVYVKSNSFGEKKIATLTNNTDPIKLVFEVEKGVDLLSYLKDENKEMVLKNIKIGENPTKTEFVLVVKPKWRFVFGL